MMNERGFSLIEVIVAIVLLGIIAAGLAAFIYPNTNFYERNVAEGLAESAIEDARQIAATNFANGLPSGNGNIYTSPNFVVNTNGTNKTYYYTRAVTDYSIGTVQDGDISNSLTTVNGTVDVKLVTISVFLVSGNVQIFQRQAYLARP